MIELDEEDTEWLSFLFAMDGLSRHRKALWNNSIIAPKPRHRYLEWCLWTLVEYLVFWPRFWATVARRKINGKDSF